MTVNKKRFGQPFRSLQSLRTPFYEGQHRQATLGFAVIGYYHASNRLGVQEDSTHYTTPQEYAPTIGLDPAEVSPDKNQVFQTQTVKIGLPRATTTSVTESLELYSKYGKDVTINQETNVTRTTEQILLTLAQECWSKGDPDISDITTYNWAVGANEFTSKLNKHMTAVAAHFTDYVIDKNGFCGPSDDRHMSITDPSHSSAIFYRRESILQVGSFRVHLPAELASGIQLRVSSIKLLHAVIKNQSDVFFDADNSTPIGK